MLLLLLFSCFFIFCDSVNPYQVIAQRYSKNPIISKDAGSFWDFNYNAAIFIQSNQVGLLVRCQNLKNSTVPFDVGQSNLALSKVTFNSGVPSATQTTKETYTPNDTTEKCGTEDPRITFYNGTYYLFYTAYNCSNAMLSSASSTFPMDVTSWQRMGYDLPGRNWSKSGAALFATPENHLTQHYLFWGDSSSPKDGIGIATSKIGEKTWTDSNNYLIKIRNDHFDSNLVESGPSPLQLKSGDFLFIYNSARAKYPSVKPNWELQYNIGFAILNKTDPTQVVQRSDDPILSPEHEWEIGNSTKYLTPNVVFLEGLIPDPNSCKYANLSALNSSYSQKVECFFGVYGGADSVLGAVQIIVGTYSSFSPSFYALNIFMFVLPFLF